MSSHAESFFERVFGMPEKDLVDDLAHNVRYTGTTLSVPSKNRSYDCGRFSVPQLGDLRRKVEEACARGKPAPRSGPPGIAHVAAPGGVLPLFSDAGYASATFQVASQLNCLEFPGPGFLPEDGITQYVHDHTQGPACSIAAAPATFFRNYLVDVTSDMSAASLAYPGRGQAQMRQINTLWPLERYLNNARHRYFAVQNGYFSANREGLCKLNERMEQYTRQELMDLIAIGVQDDTEVVLDGDLNVLERDCFPKVTQCFCSALSIGYCNARATMEEWAPLATLLLDGVYMSTVYAAFLNACRNSGAPHSNKVVFTLVGGGVFRNKPEWIAKALANAVCTAHTLGLEAILIHFGKVDEPTVRLVDSAIQEASAAHGAAPGAVPTLSSPTPEAQATGEASGEASS